MKLILSFLALLALTGAALAGSSTVDVKFETTMGEFVIALDGEQAPITVKNFLSYVDDKFYANTIWHRVIPQFMIQGGGFTKSLSEKPTHAPIPLEMTGIKNTRGTVAMARTNDPNSATAQFFVNVVDNAFLNPTGPGNGYAAFGRVIAGMDVVDKIVHTPTSTQNGMQNVPITPVVITNAYRVEQQQQ